MKQPNHAQTILSIVVGLIAIGLIFDISLLPNIAMGIGLLGLISNRFAEGLAGLWLKLAQILGKFNSYILLTLIFFVFLTPIALLMRIIQRADALKLKKQTGDSIYETRNHTYVAHDLKNIW